MNDAVNWSFIYSSTMIWPNKSATILFQSILFIFFYRYIYKHFVYEFLRAKVIFRRVHATRAKKKTIFLATIKTNCNMRGLLFNNNTDFWRNWNRSHSFIADATHNQLKYTILAGNYRLLLVMRRSGFQWNEENIL